MPFDFGAGEISILPNLKGFFSSLVSSIRPALGQAGTLGGQDLTASLKKSFSNLGGVARVAAGALGAAAIAEIGHSIHVFEDAAGQVRKLSLELGLSAADASKLRFAANELGLSTDQLSTGFGTFSKHLVDGGKAFEKYGISLDDAHGKQRSFDELLAEVSDKFRSLPKGPRQAAFAMDLFGRSGKALIPLLSEGRAGLASLSKEAERLGLVLSTKDVAAAHKATIEHNRFRLAVQGLQIELGRDYLPIQELATRGLTLFAEILHKVPSPIRSFVAGVVGLGGALAALSPLLQGAAAGLQLLSQIRLKRSQSEAAQASSYFKTLAKDAGEAGTSGLAAKLGWEAAKQGLLRFLPTLSLAATSAFVGYEAYRKLGHGVDTFGEHLDQIKPTVQDARAAYMGAGSGIDSMTEALLRTTGPASGFSDGAHRAAAAVRELARSSGSVLRGQLDRSRESLSALGMSFGDGRKALREWNSGNKKTAEQGKKDWLSFEASVRQSYAKWRTDTASQLNFVSGALNDFADKQHVSAHKIAADFLRQIHSMESFGKSLEQILSRSHGRAKSLTEALIQMGPSGVGAAEAIAGANKKTFDSIIGTWNRAEGESKKLAGNLERQIAGSLRSILSVLNAIARKLVPGFDLHVNTAQARHVVTAFRSFMEQQLGGITVPVGARIYKQQTGPGAQHGADVASSGLVRVGERGEETVWLPEGAKVLPLSLSDVATSRARHRPSFPRGPVPIEGELRIVDWGAGVAKLEARIDREFLLRGE